MGGKTPEFPAASGPIEPTTVVLSGQGRDDEDERLRHAGPSAPSRPAAAPPPLPPLPPAPTPTEPPPPPILDHTPEPEPEGNHGDRTRKVTGDWPHWAVGAPPPGPVSDPEGSEPKVKGARKATKDDGQSAGPDTAQDDEHKPSSALWCGGSCGVCPGCVTIAAQQAALNVVKGTVTPTQQQRAKEAEKAARFRSADRDAVKKDLHDAIADIPRHWRWGFYNGSAALAGQGLGAPQLVLRLLADCSRDTSPAVASGLGIAVCLLIGWKFDARTRGMFAPVAWIARIPLASAVIGLLLYSPNSIEG